MKFQRSLGISMGLARKRVLFGAKSASRTGSGRHSGAPFGTRFRPSLVCQEHSDAGRPKNSDFRFQKYVVFRTLQIYISKTDTGARNGVPERLHFVMRLHEGIFLKKKRLCSVRCKGSSQIV